MPMRAASASERPKPRPSVAGCVTSIASRSARLYGGSLRSRAHRQPDPGAAHGLDHDREADQLLAQVREMDVDHVRAGIEVVAERLAEDLRARDDLARPAQQAAEQRVLARRQRCGLVAGFDAEIVPHLY